MKKLIFGICVAISCGCGGGGSRATGQTAQTATVVDVTGQWAGTYDTGAKLQGVALKLQSAGASVSGSFVTDTGIGGTVAGSVNNNSINFNLTSTSLTCPGSYAGSGTVNGKLLNFTYSGSDCGGKYSNKTGSFEKLDDTGIVGWSGNWWGVAGPNMYSLITLKSTDDKNYSGRIKMVDKFQVSGTYTADLSGVKNSTDNWLPLTIGNDHNINFIISGTTNISRSTDGTTSIGNINFNIQNGGVITFNGTDLIKIP